MLYTVHVFANASSNAGQREYAQRLTVTLGDSGVLLCKICGDLLHFSGNFFHPVGSWDVQCDNKDDALSIFENWRNLGREDNRVSRRS